MDTKESLYTLIDQHYRKYYKVLTKRAYYAFKNEADAEEAVQDMYTKACTSWESYSTDDFDAWMATIFQTSVTDKWRDIQHNGMTVEYKPNKDKTALGSTPEEKFTARLSEKKVRLLIGKHKPQVQQVLILHIFQGMKPHEIAKAIKEDVKSVYVTISRFKLELRKLQYENSSV